MLLIIKKKQRKALWNYHGTGYGPTELKLLRSTDLFRRDVKTFLFHSVYGHQDTDWFCDAPSVF